MIEELTDPMLADIIEEHEYVAVYFRGNCTSGQSKEAYTRAILLLDLLRKSEKVILWRNRLAKREYKSTIRSLKSARAGDRPRDLQVDFLSLYR
jgi:hypothetical protein